MHIYNLYNNSNIHLISHKFMHESVNMCAFLLMCIFIKMCQSQITPVVTEKSKYLKLFTSNKNWFIIWHDKL